MKQNHDDSPDEQEQVLRDAEARLVELEELLQAIQSGEVDAVVLPPSGDGDNPIFTRQGADHPYRVFVETMREGAITMTDGDRIAYSNEHFAQMVGEPLERVMGSSLCRFVAPLDLPLFEALIERAGRHEGRGEVQMRSADGAIFPAYLSMQATAINGEESVSVMVTDLSERKRAEQLMVSERMARAILEQATEAIIVCGPEGKITQISHRARSLSPRNPLFEHFDQAYPLQPLKGATAAGEPGEESTSFSIERVLAGQTYQGLSMKMERDGEELALLLQAGPIYGTGRELVGAIVTLTDISALKKVERELRQLNTDLERRVEERSARVQTLSKALVMVERWERQRLAGLLHDHLQQILYALRNRLFLAASDEAQLQGEVLESLDSLVGSALTTIRSLVAELEPPKEIYESPNSAMQWLAAKMRELHGLDVHVDCDCGGSLDPQLTEMLLPLARELLFNVVKHAAVDTANLSLKHHAEEIWLEVRDEGCGFDPEAMDSRQNEGTGAGLTGMLQRLQPLGASLNVSSRPGHGTRVCIKLPRAIGANATAPLHRSHQDATLDG